MTRTRILKYAGGAMLALIALDLVAMAATAWLGAELLKQ